MGTNDYFVIGLWEGIWDENDPGKYFRGLLQDKEDLVVDEKELLAGFDNYLGVIMSPPVESDVWSYGDFNRYRIKVMRSRITSANMRRVELI